MIRYIGEGSWLPGVPARDLTAVEFERHQEAIEAADAAGHVLYVAEPEAKAKLFVTSVAGIGEKTAAALAAAEIVTVEDLVAADAEFIDAALDDVDYVTVEINPATEAGQEE